MISPKGKKTCFGFKHGYLQANYPQFQGCNCQMLQKWHVHGDPPLIELRLPRRGGSHDVPKPLLRRAFHDPLFAGTSTT